MRLFALALLLSLTACNGAARELDRAHDLALKKEYAAAAKLYESALIDLGRDESDHAREERATALKALGDIYYLYLPEPAQAVRYYRDLAERYPEHPSTFEARANLADLLRDKFHDTRAALAQLAALVQSFPNHLDTDRYQYLAAQDYFSLRDYGQTETELHLLLSRYPGTGVKVDAQMLLASSMALQNHRADAIALYSQIAAEHPGADAGRANLELGRLYEDAGEFDKAETALARALADHPEPRLVSAALERVKRRVAAQRPVDLHDHAAIFDHKTGANVAEGGD